MKKLLIGVLLLYSMLCASALSTSSVSSTVSSPVSLDLSGTYSGQGYNDLTISGQLTGVVVDTFASECATNTVTVQGKLEGVLCGSLLDTSASSSSDWGWVDVYDTVVIEGFFTQVLVHPDSTTDSVAQLSYIKKGATLIGRVQFLTEHVVNHGSLPMINQGGLYQLVPEISGRVDGTVDMMTSGIPGCPVKGIVRVLGSVKGEFVGELCHTPYNHFDHEDSIDMRSDMRLLLQAALIDTTLSDTVGYFDDSITFSIALYDLFLPQGVDSSMELQLSPRKIYGVLEDSLLLDKIYEGIMSGVTVEVVVDTLFQVPVVDTISWCTDSSQLWTKSQLDTLFTPQSGWKELHLSNDASLLLPRSVRLSATEVESPYSSFHLTESFKLDHNSVSEPNFLAAIPLSRAASLTLLSGRGGRHFEPPFQKVTIDGKEYRLYSISSSEALLSVVNRGSTAIVSSEPVVKSKSLSLSLSGRGMRIIGKKSFPIVATLYDLHGRQVQQFSGVPAAKGLCFTAGRELATGLYLLEVVQGSSSLHRSLYLP